MSQIAPELAVVIAAAEGLETVRRLVQYLALQTVRERIELVFVVREGAGVQLDKAEVDGFCSVVVLEVDSFRSVNQARLAGVVVRLADLLGVLRVGRCDQRLRRDLTGEA